MVVVNPVINSGLLMLLISLVVACVTLEMHAKPYSIGSTAGIIGRYDEIFTAIGT